MDYNLMKKNRNNNKRIIIIIGIILVVGITIFFILNRKNIFKDDKKVAINDKPVVEKIDVTSNINEITVVEGRIEKLNKSSKIFVKIKNNTNDIIEQSNLKLTIYDKDNNILLISVIENLKEIAVGEEKSFQISTKDDITNASKYVVDKFEEQKEND